MQQANLITEAKVLSAVRQYLDDFFTDLQSEDWEEYKSLYRFWCSAIKTIPPGGIALELGVGPTIYTTIPLAEHFSEIHLADYVEESLTEVIKWLQAEPDCFDWRSFIQLVLQEEGKQGTEQEIAEREAKLRQVITKITTCDICSPAVLGKDSETYNLVTAHYCTEVATTTSEEWYEAINNISQLVNSNGYLLLSVTTDLALENWLYHSKPAQASPIITSEYVKTCLKDAGMNMDSLKLELISAPVDRPYTNTILIFVQKLA
jgi:hypothetical protein